MKDIFEFNHIDNLCQNQTLKPSKTFIVTTVKNTGVLSGLIRVINFLMMFLVFLEYAWCQ